MFTKSMSFRKECGIWILKSLKSMKPDQICETRSALEHSGTRLETALERSGALSSALEHSGTM